MEKQDAHGKLKVMEDNKDSIQSFPKSKLQHVSQEGNITIDDLANHGVRYDDWIFLAFS